MVPLVQSILWERERGDTAGDATGSDAVPVVPAAAPGAVPVTAPAPTSTALTQSTYKYRRAAPTYNYRSTSSPEEALELDPDLIELDARVYRARVARAQLLGAFLFALGSVGFGVMAEMQIDTA